MTNFKYYNDILIKNTSHPLTFEGIINLHQVKSDQELMEIIFNFANFDLNSSIINNLVQEEQEEYKKIILTIIQLFFTNDLPNLSKKQKIKLFIAKDNGYIFKFAGQLPFNFANNALLLLNDILSLNKENFKERYYQILKTHPSLDGKSETSFGLLSMIRDHSVKIFTNIEAHDDIFCLVSIIVVVEKLYTRSWNYGNVK